MSRESWAWLCKKYYVHILLQRPVQPCLSLLLLVSAHKIYKPKFSNNLQQRLKGSQNLLWRHNKFWQLTGASSDILGRSAQDNPLLFRSGACFSWFPVSCAIHEKKLGYLLKKMFIDSSLLVFKNFR